jgi:hypothetical protein
MTKRAILFLLLAATLAQAQPATESADILERIPSNVLACGVIPNLQQGLAQADELFEEFNSHWLLGPVLPDSTLPLLSKLLADADMKTDLSTRRGAALVLVPPESVGFDIEQMIAWELAPLTGNRPDDPPTPRWPLVALLPGGQVTDLWPRAEPRREGPNEVFAYRGLELHARRLDEHYLMVSPTPRALDALENPVQSLLQTLAPKHRRLMEQSAVSLHANMHEVAPLADEVLKTVDKRISQAMGKQPGYYAMPAVMIQKSLPFLRYPLTHQEAWTAGIELRREGAILQQLTSWKPESPTGRKLLAYQRPQSPLMDRIAGVNRVVAMGNHNLPSHTESMGSLFNMYFEAVRTALLMASDDSGLQEETLLEIRRLASSLYGRVGQSQIVFGSPDSGQAVYTLAASLKVDDAQAFGKELSRLVEVFDELAGQLVASGNGPDRRIRFVYRSTGETVEGEEVFEITPLHPNLEDLQPESREALEATLGEPRIRLLFLAPDQQSVLLWMGGTVEVARDLLQSNPDRPAVLHEKDMARALEFLPEEPAALTLLDFRKGFNLIHANLKRHDPAHSVPEIGITCTVPVAIASKAEEDATVRHVAFVPARLLRDFAILALTGNL